MKTNHQTILIILFLTLFAYGLERLIPSFGSSITALITGMIAGQWLPEQTTSKKISGTLLKYGIILLGFGLSFAKLQLVGLASYAVILPVIAISFIVALSVGKLFNIPIGARTLVAMGTAICGGSAIAAAAPIIEAEDDDIAFSISAVFLYNMLALVVFPLLGQLLHLNDVQFGVFAGAAVNDTSSVVATGFAFSDTAGSIATVVKMARTLMIVPVCLALLYTRIRRHSGQTMNWQTIRQLFPSFIAWFLLAVTITSVIPIPQHILSVIKLLSRITMTAALVGVGLSVDLRKLRKTGLQSLGLGGVTWVAVMTMSLLMIYFLRIGL